MFSCTLAQSWLAVRADALRRFSLALWLVAASFPLMAADPKAAQFYEDALVRYEKKDLAGAIIQLKNAIQIDRKMLPVHVLLGKALLANGNPVAAEVAFNEALQLGVNRVEVVVPLANAVVGQGRLQEVTTGQRFVIAGLPPDVRGQLLLIRAGAFSDLNSPKEALKLIEEVKALDRNAPEPWLAEVPVQVRSRRFKEAVVAADRALALAPTSAEAHYQRGSIAHARGQAGLAMAAYDRAIELRAAHAEALIARAGLSLDQGRLDDTMRDVAEVRRLAPSDPRAPYLGSLVSERKGDPVAAREALNNITGLVDPIPIEFLRYRTQVLILGGLAHFGLGQNEKARPYLEIVARQNPESPVAKLLAQICMKDRNYDGAINWLEAYLKGNASDMQGVVLLATAQLSRGRHARAAQLLRDALKMEDSPRMRTFLGLTLVGGDKVADALTELEQAYRRDPGQVAAGAALVDLYLRNKQAPMALAVAQDLVKRSPGNAQFQTLLGMASMEAGDSKRARTAFDSALKLDASFIPAQLNVARLEARENDYDAATRRLNAILTRDSKHVETLGELGLIAERRGRITEASALLEKAADHSAKSDLRPALALVEYYLRINMPDAALTALKRLDSRAPDNLAVLMAGARVRMANKDLTGAQQFYSRASRAAEFDATQQTQIALQQLAADDAKAAQYSLTKALQGQVDYLPAKALLVDVNIRLGNLPQADQLAQEIAARQPKLALGQSLIGDVAAARGQTLAAISAYQRAHQIEPTASSLMRLFRATSQQNSAAASQLAEKWLQANPRDIEVRRLLADSFARSGNFAAAKKAYEAVVALAPTDAETLNNLANVMILAKDPEALKVAERALALRPAVPHIIGTTGWAAFQAGQSDRALQLLRDARLRDPGNPDTRYFLGAILASKGRTSEARDELQLAVRAGNVFNHSKEAEQLLRTMQ